MRGFAAAYRAATKRDTSTLIELRTERSANRREHQRLDSLVRAALSDP